MTTPFAYNPTQSLIVEVTQCGLSGTGSGVPQNALTGTRRTYMTPTSCVQAYGGQDGSLPGIGLTLVSAGPCTNPPTPGTVTSTLNPVPCPTNSFTLGLTGGTGGSGQTYQWQSSPNNSTWSIITGATNAAYTTTQLASTYYRCQVTCGTTVASGSLLVTLTTPPLTGIYTINNLLPTGGTNFQTFTAAINALNCAGPGTGGVIFNVVAGQTTVDGIIRFGGCDYVTFDGIDLQYPITNITATTQMEWGYGIVKASATDGSQNITIKNCTITLQKINTASVGIYGGNHIATSTTSLTVTAFSGTNSYLKLYNNTIQNCYTGISITGYADATSPYAYYDHFNEVGVQGGNIIRNFGGGAVTTYGVYTIYQDSLFVNNNNIGGGTGTTTTNYGIMISTGTNSCITVYNNTVSDTTATLTSSSYGIAINNAGVTGTNNTVIVKRNTVQGMTNTAAGTTCALYGFYIYYTVSINLYIDSNNYMNNKWGNTSGTFTGSIYEFYIYPYTLTPTAGSVQYVTNNYISGNKRIQSAVSTGTQYGMYIYYGLQTVNAYNNVIENDTLPTTSTNYGLYVYNYYSTTANYYNNTVRNIYKPNGSTGAFYGIYISNAAPSGTFNYYNNSVNNLTNGVGAASLYGHYIAATSVTKNIYGDTAYAIRTMLGGSVYGIYQSGGTTTNLYRNTVYDLRTSSGFGYGITVASGTTNNVYNNYISDIRVDSLSTTLALMGLYLSGGTTNNVYYNTIYLNSASHLTGSYTFGTAALYASSTPITDLRNNIAVNMSTPGTVVGGYSTAYYRSTSTLTTYAATSNNNCFYSGTPGQYRLIHFDGTNSYQTMAQYQSLVGPRDGASFTENPPFINVATKPYNLHLNTTTVTNCESGAQRITAPIGIADDWDGNVRWGEIGYSGTGAAPDVGADEGEFAHSPQMVVDSTNTVQVTGYAYIGQINQHIIRIDVATSNSYNQFTVNANGTTDINEINLTPARIYYTGTSTTFSASTLFGSATPTLIDFPISGNQKLSPGTNYFWLAYDVSPTALAGNYIDGECNSVQITSGSLTPLNTAPTGNKTIIGPMAGNYYVGQGQTFPNFATLTDAVINLNSRGISGPTTLYLTNSSSVPYNRINGETFPIVINSITGASALSPVTIVPNTGVQPVIQDTIATCLIKFNGTDYLTLDGSNKGTNTKDLTIYNASTAVSTTPLFISSLGVGLGSTYLTIKNCNISGGLNTVSTQYGIYIGGATVGSVGNDNDYITIQNNYIKKA
ncbi:MAG: hypothetical protein NTU73_15695 [Ignavibacteriae bacterium]|nr:hypothetical protein [Ignavibacteriota bacterium]